MVEKAIRDKFNIPIEVIKNNDDTNKIYPLILGIIKPDPFINSVLS